MRDFLRQTISLVLAMVLVMGIMVFPSYAVPEDIGAKGWVTVHTSSGLPDYSAEGYPLPAVLKSELVIKDSSDAVIPPEGPSARLNA